MIQTPIQAKYQHRMESKAREWRTARMKEHGATGKALPILLFITVTLFLLGGGCQ